MTTTCLPPMISRSRRVGFSGTEAEVPPMDASTPLTLAAAGYSDRARATDDFEAAWNSRPEPDLGHTSIAVLTTDASGTLRIERHDSTAKHLAWGGALLGSALTLVAPTAGAGFLASSRSVGGAGAVVDRFRHKISNKDIEAAAGILASGVAGLVVVAVNQRGEDIEPLFQKAIAAFTTTTTWGDLDAKIEQELADAQANPSGT
jgi:hypothetical protein